MKLANKYATKWNLDRLECKSAAHLGLVKAVHTHWNDKYLQAEIGVRVVGAIQETFIIGKDRRQKPKSEEISEYHIPTSRINFVEMDGRLAWEKAKSLLSPRDYQILHQSLANGLSFRSIAKQMHLNAMTVSDAYNDALDQLRLQAFPISCSGMGAINVCD